MCTEWFNLRARIRDKKIYPVKLSRDSDISLPTIYHKHTGYYATDTLSLKKQTRKNPNQQPTKKPTNQPPTPTQQNQNQLHLEKSKHLVYKGYAVRKVDPCVKSQNTIICNEQLVVNLKLSFGKRRYCQKEQQRRATGTF